MIDEASMLSNSANRRIPANDSGQVSRLRHQSNGSFQDNSFTSGANITLGCLDLETMMCVPPLSRQTVLTPLVERDTEFYNVLLVRDLTFAVAQVHSKMKAK